MEKDYFDIKNEYFYDFIDDLFKINKSKTWEEISKNVTLEKIKRTYRKFAEIYPRNFDYLKELEKSKSSFTCIHYGEIKASRIINEIVRFSLYTDKIIVFHPLQNPSVTNQQIDPRRNPKYWIIDFIDSLYFYIVIQKWVKSGIVKLIINPYEYDFKLRKEIDSLAIKRFNSSGKESLNKDNINAMSESLAEQFAFMYKNRSKDHIIKSLLGMSNPIFTIPEAQDFAEQIIQSIPISNPLHNKNMIPISNKVLAPTKGGGPLESILLISEKTDGSIYTPNEMNWQQIKKFGLNDFWTKTNWLYSKMPLNFLNNVETNFALEIRKEERLSGVRTQFKKVFSELNSLSPEKLTDLKIKELHEEFTEEVKKADAEWNEIITQANLQRKYWLMANTVVPIIKSEISILPLALGSASWLLYNEQSRRQKEKFQRQKNPISVFIDLKNQRQNFFTILRNCLI